MLFRGIVVQVLIERSSRLLHAHPLAFGVIGDLIAADLAQAKIARFRVGDSSLVNVESDMVNSIDGVEPWVQSLVANRRAEALEVRRRLAQRPPIGLRPLLARGAAALKRFRNRPT
jgi:hypothetical protein